MSYTLLILSILSSLPLLCSTHTYTTPQNTTLINNGDIGFLLSCSITIFLMVAGIGFLYGGLVDSANISHMIILSFASSAVVAIQWSCFGYFLIFSDGMFWGRFDQSLLFQEKEMIMAYNNIPMSVDATVHLMYAMLSPGLVSGAAVWRMKLFPWMLFTLLWTTFAYDPVAHWIWYHNGWLKQLGAVDFAGGTVIHLLGGVSGLTLALYLGPIKKNPKRGQSIAPHNSAIHWIGVSLMWAGWMAFNGASAYAANIHAAQAIYNTAMGGASGYLTYMILESTVGNIVYKKPPPQRMPSDINPEDSEELNSRSPLQARSNISMVFERHPSSLAVGGLYGLIAVTPAAGYVGSGQSILIGLIVSVVNFVLTQIMLIFRFGKIIKEHDHLDVFLFHGISGFVGTILTGVFYDESGLRTDKLLGVQLLSSTVTTIWGLIVTLLSLCFVSFCYWIFEKVKKRCCCYYGLNTGCKNSIGSGETWIDNISKWECVQSIIFPTTEEDFSFYKVYPVDVNYYRLYGYNFIDYLTESEEDEETHEEETQNSY